MINPFKSKKGLGRGLSSLIGDKEKIVDKKKTSRSYEKKTELHEISKRIQWKPPWGPETDALPLPYRCRWTLV